MNRTKLRIYCSVRIQLSNTHISYGSIECFVSVDHFGFVFFFSFFFCRIFSRAWNKKRKMKWWQSYFARFSLKFRGLKMLKAARACGQIIARRNERRAQCELENKPTPLLCMCERAGARASAPPVKFFDSPLWRLRSPFCPHLLSPFDHRGSTRVFLTKRKLPCWEIKEKSSAT